jgi:hypothetical protein
MLLGAMRKIAGFMGQHLRTEWPLMLAVIAGTALRLDQIGSQIPLDDEWHTIHAVVRSSFAWMLTNFAWTYYSIPWAVYHRVVADTVGLSELWLRAPALICGIASLIAFPLLARRWIGRTASHLFAVLLSLSPLHVYFSRFARPYSVALLLSFVAVAAFFVWWEQGGKPWAALYVVGAVLGPFFHLSLLATGLAPIAFGLAACALIRHERRKFGDVLRLSVAVMIAYLLLFGPPLLISGSWLARKSGLGAPTIRTLADASELLSGTGNRGMLAVVALLVAIGALSLWRERRAFASYIGLISIATVAMPFISRPYLVEIPIAFARYCLFIVPASLIVIALALVRVAESLRRFRPVAVVAIPTIFCLAHFFLGPLPRIHFHPNDWTNHGLYQYDYSPRNSAWRCPEEIPRFYIELSREKPESRLIVEAPWWFGWYTNVYPCYQRVHRQRMLVGFVGKSVPGQSKRLPRPGEVPRDDLHGRFRFRTFVHVGDHAELRRRGVRYVVFHRAIEREVAAEKSDYRVKVARWIREYRALYGAPVYRDELLTVFDVMRWR